MSDFNKITSTFDLSGVGSEQLFTELTPEQAAVIKGGASFLVIESIQAVSANADSTGRDETYINVNGSRLWGPQSVGTGDGVNINRGLGFEGSATIQLFDDDDFLNGGDDYIGGFNVAGPTNGTARRQVSGSGSTYDVFYRVFA